MQEFLPRVYCYVNEFNLSDLSKLRKNINIIYRNYNKIDHLNNLLKLKSFCKKANIKLYLSNNIKLSIKLGLNGVYIPSFNKKLNYCGFYNLPENFKIIGSAHNLKQIKIKECQNVEIIFLSSLFKKNENYLGMNKFKLVSNLTKKKIVALGGISKKNLKKLNLLNNPGFAGISFFEQKKGP